MRIRFAVKRIRLPRIPVVVDTNGNGAETVFRDAGAARPFAVISPGTMFGVPHVIPENPVRLRHGRRTSAIMPDAKWDSRLLYHLLDLVRLFKGRRQRLLREKWFPGGGGGANDRQAQCLSRGKTDRIHIGIRDRLVKIRAQLLRRKPLPANLEVVFGNIAAGMQRRFGGFYQIGQMLPLGQHPASHNGESDRICGAGIGACLFVHMQS